MRPFLPNTSIELVQTRGGEERVVGWAQVNDYGNQLTSRHRWVTSDEWQPREPTTFRVVEGHADLKGFMAEMRTKWPSWPAPAAGWFYGRCSNSYYTPFIEEMEMSQERGDAFEFGPQARILKVGRLSDGSYRKQYYALGGGYRQPQPGDSRLEQQVRSDIDLREFINWAYADWDDVTNLWEANAHWFQKLSAIV